MAMDNIYNKLLQVQAQLKAPKNQFNSFGKYKYRSCEDILEAVKPLLLKHGLTLVISDEVAAMPGEYQSESIDKEGNPVRTHSQGRSYVIAHVTVFDSTGASIQSKAYAREPEDKKGMDASQITGAASSYARKYALAGLFLLDDTKDADHASAPSGDEVRDTIAEIKACTDLKELEAHYKANLEFIKEHKLERYYTTRKKELQ